MKQFKCDLDKIHVNQMFNSRFEIVPSTCRGLAESIEKHGLLQPVIVRRATQEDGVEADYVLLAGFRRFIAFKYLLKRDSIPVKVVAPKKRQHDAEINFVENLIREDLSLMEEAIIVRNLLTEGLSKSEICRRLDRSRQWVNSRESFLDLPDEVKLMLESGNLTIKEVMTLVKYYKNKPEKVIVSEAQKILHRRKERKKTLEELSHKKVGAKQKASYLAGYLLERTAPDRFQQAISVLLWVQGEVPTSRLFELLKLSTEEAFEYEATVEGK